MTEPDPNVRYTDFKPKWMRDPASAKEMDEAEGNCAWEIGRNDPEEDDRPDVYCNECGEDDRKKLAYDDAYANGYRWKCQTCGHEFLTGREEKDG